MPGTRVGELALEGASGEDGVAGQVGGVAARLVGLAVHARAQLGGLAGRLGALGVRLALRGGAQVGHLGARAEEEGGGLALGVAAEALGAVVR